ncbi:MAG TPA: diacylglycerol kinase family protein [Puia sp.]|nr:diacylglycerol kinase family protein [Puia sp.]
MPRKIVYLINPISGTKGKSSLQELIARRTKALGIDFEIVATNASGDYGFLRQKIIKERITDAVICGGDGTASAVASSLMGVNVNIGIIPMGSGNGLALAAKIPTQPSKALDIIFAGKASFIDGFYVNNEFSCMLCGIGFDALVAHEFAKQKKRGLQAYIKVAAINFFKTSPYPFEVRLKNKSLAVDAFFICIANGNQFGNNFTIAPKASLRDGLIDIVIVKKMSKFLLPFSVINQVSGINGVQNINDYAKKKHIIYFQTQSLTIHNLSEAPMHIDGDPKKTSASFDIRVVPKALKLIQP